MNQKPHEGRVSAIVAVVGKRWVLLSVVIISVMAITFLINFFILEETYEAQVKIIYPLKRGAGFIKSNLGALDIPIRGFSTILDSEPTIYNHIAIIKSRSVREKVVDRLNLTEHYGDKLRAKTEVERRRGAVRMLGRRMEVGDSVKGLVTIKVKDQSNKKAAEIANTIVDATGEYLLYLYSETHTRMVKFLEGRRDSVDTELTEVEEEIKRLKEETGILSIDFQAEQMIGSFSELEQALLEVEIEYRGSLASLAATEDFSDDVKRFLDAVENGEVDLSAPESLYLIGGDSSEGIAEPQPIAKALEDLNIAFLRRTLSELEMELQTKKLAFTDEHPDIIVLKEQVRDARKSLSEELLKFYDAALTTLEIETIGYRAQVGVIKGVIEEFEGRMAVYPADERILLEYEREKKVMESVLMVVEQELEEAEIRVLKMDLPFTLLDEALPPRQPVAPRLIVNTVISGALSGWLTLYLVFWFETRARRRAAQSVQGTS